MKRVKELWDILVSQQVPITTTTLATKLGVSERTIQSDLKKMEKMMKESSCALVRKPGVGTRLEWKKDSDLSEMYSLLDYSDVEEKQFTQQDRCRYMLNELFLGNLRQKLSHTLFSEELYVSRTCIYKDASKIDAWLEPYGISLNCNKERGLHLKGKEASIREAMADHLDRKQIYTMTNMNEKILKGIWQEIEEALDLRFSLESLESLMVHTAVALKRIALGQELSLSKTMMEKLSRRQEMSIMRVLGSKLNHSFHVNINDSELGYLLLHLLGAKKEGYHPKPSIEVEEDETLATTMAKEIVEISERALALDLSRDGELLDGLILHLKPTIHRIQYGLHLKNPILNEIKKNYPYIFGVAWMSSTVFEKYLDTTICEEEIGYLAIHIGAAVERNKTMLKTLVVCHSGIGTSQLLSARLKKAFRDLDIVGVTSYYHDEVEEKDYDFIVSTIPLHTLSPHVVVSPILTQQDIHKTQSCINDLLVRKQKGKGIGLFEDLISIETTANSKEEALKTICQQLYLGGYVREGYEKEVMEREHIAPTVIGHGIAIPHAGPANVKKSCISAKIFKEGIPWGEEEVCFILIVCIAQEDLHLARKLFGRLYEVIDLQDCHTRVDHLDEVGKIKGFLEGLIHGIS